MEQSQEDHSDMLTANPVASWGLSFLRELMG